MELSLGADSNYFMSYSICTAENNLYLCCGNFSSSGASYCFYKIENEALVCEDNLYEWRMGQVYSYYNPDQEITAEEYDAILQKYTVEKELFSTGVGYTMLDVSVQERGLLPSQKEYWAQTVVEVNGVAVELSADPYTTQNGTIMAPVRDVLEAMGVAVYAKVESPRVAIFASTQTNSLRIANYISEFGFDAGDTWEENQWADEIGWGNLYDDGRYRYSFNGNGDISIVVQNFGGKTFVPIETIAGYFGADVVWNSPEKILQIVSTISEDDRMSQTDLAKLVGFSLEDAENICYENEYYPFNGSAGRVHRGEYQLAFGKSIWKLRAVDYSNQTLGKIVVFNDGRCEYTPVQEYLE